MLLGLLETLEMPEAIRCILLCMVDVMLCTLEAVEGRRCSLEMMQGLDPLEVMRCMLRRMLDAVGEWAQFQGFEISMVAVFSLHSAIIAYFLWAFHPQYLPHITVLGSLL